ncbi:MAG: PEP-CTERM sorting domain-containing protein [Verrucomicrobiales bacterium]
MKTSPVSRLFAKSLSVASLLFLQTVVTEGANVLVDFGSDATTTASPTNGLSWNNITSAVDGAVIDAVDANTGAGTGIGVAITSRFNGINTNGTLVSTVYPVEATRDSFYGNTATFNGIEVPNAQVTITGLQPGGLYAISLYASRTATDNRETQYVLTGDSSSTVFLDVASNDDNFAFVPSMGGDASNSIVIDVTPGPNNTNGSGFFYLGALQINSVDSIPEPSASLLVVVGVGMMTMIRRRR